MAQKGRATMSVALETGSAPETTTTTVHWPEALRHPDRQLERSVLAHLLSQPLNSIAGEEQLAELAAAVNLETTEAIRLLKRMAGKGWVGWNDIAGPRAWVPKATRRTIAVVPVWVRPTAVSVPAPTMVVEAPPAETPATPVPRVLTGRRGRIEILWPEFLQGKHLMLTRAVITYLIGVRGYAIEGDEAFARLISFVSPEGGPPRTMRSLAPLERSGWIGRNIFGTPRVWLTEKTLRAVKARVLPPPPEPLAPRSETRAEVPTIGGAYNPRWQELAACGGENQNDFFVDPDAPTEEVADVEEKLPGFAVCGFCPVRLDCLAFGLRTKPDGFIYGGLSPREQYAIRRRKNYSGVEWTENMLMALHALNWALARRGKASRPNPPLRRSKPGRQPVPTDIYHERQVMSYTGREREGMADLRGLALEVMRVLLKENAAEAAVMFANRRFTVICRKSYGVSLSVGMLNSVKRMLVNEGWATVWEKPRCPTKYRVLPAGQLALDQAA
jgi:hypothetical protein